MEKQVSTLSSLYRFRLRDEHLVEDRYIEEEIFNAFEETRCFDFQPDKEIIEGLLSGEEPESHNRYIAIKNSIFDRISGNDQTVRNRFYSDIRLSDRIVKAIMFIHRAIAEDNFTGLMSRRFVLIKERPGVPTIYHISNETTVISHVGQGLRWDEKPSIYLGLNIFEALSHEYKQGGKDIFNAFKYLLKVEGRAIETGFSHIEIFPPEFSIALNTLVDETIRVSALEEVDISQIPERKSVRKFTPKTREKYIKMLDARLNHDALNFNYEKNIKGVRSLERLARRYKKGNDLESLREVVRLLVSASGHDIHEVRNRSNILLERIFSCKEFDAPLAVKFINLRIGETHNFEFELPAGKKDYTLRIYKNRSEDRLALDRDINFTDINLNFSEETGLYTASYSFTEYGHYDFILITKKKRSFEWVKGTGVSGRVNVIPDIRGEIILEIFPDIHGHTRIYWRDKNGHPGLVYNENGEIIRLGRFSDITAHLEHLMQRYRVTAIYLLGVQKRGDNWSDWAPEASSPSPFSPMSLVEIEPSLGGSEEFQELVKKAHKLGIKIILDIVPHLNRRSTELADENAVRCYDDHGSLVVRASTDGRFGSWNDGKLLNYRRFEIWEWLCNSIETLIEKYDIDGIRFDSAHAVPIMMKKNNFRYIYDEKRTDEEMLEGTIIVNEKEYDHFITTGFYDSACRDYIGIPLHNFLMFNIERKLRKTRKKFFINIAECYWGHERYLTRTGIVPYNSALFKICENIIHGKTDVREIYHVYDNYFPSALPPGTELLGILGNHDERRALNTFGHRGLRAAVALTVFMSNIVMDYEGSAEGEGWKVYLDNIYVNWNQFEYAAHRSLEKFYEHWYGFHRETRSRGYLIWANNNIVAASMRFTDDGFWIGVFNFSDSNQSASIQFDNPRLPIPDDESYRVVDVLYSPITDHYGYFTGRELKVSRINTIVSFTERVKLLKLEKVKDRKQYYGDFLRDSYFRMCKIGNESHFSQNFSFREISEKVKDYNGLKSFILDHLVPKFKDNENYFLGLGLKRAFYYIFKNNLLGGRELLDYIEKLSGEGDMGLSALGEDLSFHNKRGPLVFMSAEAEPFSKSGGLANVVYELPRELVKQGETVYVITGMYSHGDEKSVKKMKDALAKYDIKYTGKNVRFKIMHMEYEVGVHSGDVEGVKYFLLDHYEFFDGLYWGITAEEKLRRRVAFARACAEVILAFGLEPVFTFTNDAFAGIFNGIVRCDHFYSANHNFRRTTFLHIIHNGGWQYFDSYDRYERGFDHFFLFNLNFERSWEFTDPVFPGRLNCMAAGIRFADRTITVSPSYAKQIENACDGLESILHNVLGISNAIGEDFTLRINTKFKETGFIEHYYPALMQHIKENDTLREKIENKYSELVRGELKIEEIRDESRRYTLKRVLNKMMLQLQRGLKVDPDILLFTMIHRISEQKGFQVLLEASKGIFENLGCQAIIGGAISSGDNKGEELAHGLYLLTQYYPDSVSLSFGFQDISVPLLSADIFCMPSMNEPGGISQIEAFACGCVVVARAIGGLRDTVSPIIVKDDNVTGNGFLFSDFNAWAFYDAMERASRFFKTNSFNTIYKARKNAEEAVYFWDRPAKIYIEEIYKLKEIIRVIN